MEIWFEWLRRQRGSPTKRGGAGYGITTTAIPYTSYGTAPPSSTVTKDRGIVQPEIAGSYGGFLGLVSGIAVVVLLGLFLGIYLYNRHRRRLLRQRRGKSTNPLPSLSYGDDPNRQDPYADAHEIPAFEYGDLPTPRASKFARPPVHRQTSSEWDIPLDNPVPGNSRGAPSGSDNSHLARGDEEAIPLRDSSSPRPHSPNNQKSHPSDRDSTYSYSTTSSTGPRGKRKPAPTYNLDQNPFSSKEDLGQEALLDPSGSRPLAGLSKQASESMDSLASAGSGGTERGAAR